MSLRPEGKLARTADECLRHGGGDRCPLWFATFPPPAGGSPVSATDDAAQALDREVARYARGTFTLLDARHFTLTEKATWQQVMKPLANRIAVAGGGAVPIDWHRPGYDLIALFRLPDGSCLAVAMDHRADGRTVAYYRIALRTR